MVLFDIFRKEKKKDKERLKRPPKGAFKQVEKSLKKTQKTQTDDKKEKKEKTGLPARLAEAPTKRAGQAGAIEGKSELASIIISSPHITEKTTVLTEKNVYVFRVSPRANKIMIKRAVKELYGFSPVRVNIVNIPSKVRSSRGKKGVKSGYKKAMVYLKKGDKIELA